MVWDCVVPWPSPLVEHRATAREVVIFSDRKRREVDVVYFVAWDREDEIIAMAWCRLRGPDLRSHDAAVRRCCRPTDNPLGLGDMRDAISQRAIRGLKAAGVVDLTERWKLQA